MRLLVVIFIWRFTRIYAFLLDAAPFTRYEVCISGYDEMNVTRASNTSNFKTKESSKDIIS